MLAQIYAAGTRLRRRTYAARPDLRRRLDHPVISVGNLTLGGSGKTPLVIALARLLARAGERPAVISRGYARQDPVDGVVVVSADGRVLADLPRAGDEPLLIARAVREASVLVCPDRHLAGRLAERRLGASVHILDDGYQHLALARDVDLLLLDPADIDAPRVVPAGRLREPLQAASEADAIVFTGDADAQAADAAARALGVARGFRLTRRLGAPRPLEPDRGPTAAASAPRVLAMAGIAAPQRFFGDLRGAGWDVVDELTFPDHYRYRERDLAKIARRRTQVRADLIVTTEKDAVRLLCWRPLPFPVTAAPLTVVVEPEAAFANWLIERLRAARQHRRRAERGT